MTVRELIDILNTCDENANVVIEQWDGLGFVLQWAKYGLKR
nr:MAG: hypothetical protein [Bacteriophage sp.]